MITISDLNFAYDKKAVLKNLSANLETKEIHGIIGLNGSGKTTFFNVLCGYEKDYGGKITSDGSSIKKSEFALLETENYFYPKLTGAEYLNIFSNSKTGSNQNQFEKLFDLPLNELVDSYSTGMKKKLLLLCNIKQNKNIYVLDEPFNGLDLEANKTLEYIIQGLKEKGKTVLISSHIIDPLITLCDKIHFLSNGSFKKTYAKAEFSLLEEEIFGEMKEKIKNNLNFNL